MIDELKAAEPGETIWDKGEKQSVKGLHLRVRSADSKNFYVYYRTRAGQERRVKIGAFGDISLAQARARAKAIVDRVAVGEDPKAEWDVGKAELSVSELFEKAWGDYWSKDRYQTSGWAKQVQWSWKRHVKPSFGSLKLSELTPATVRAWHAKLGETSIYNANQALKILSRIYRYAEEQEIRVQHSNPCNLVKSFAEKKRERYASEDEIRKIVTLLDASAKRYPASVAFLYLLMFSGSRPRAIERATWDQIKEFELDGERFGILTFRGKTSEKTGADERVILPPQAMRVLGWLPRVEGMTITGIKMPRTLWRRIKQEAGCPDLWARDWRRTFATIGMTGGVDMWAIGEILNHRDTNTTKRYAKVMDGRRVEAVTMIASRIDEIIADKPEILTKETSLKVDKPA